MKSPGSSVMNCMKGFYYQGEDLLVDKSSSSEQSRGAKDIYIYLFIQGCFETMGLRE